MAPKAKIHDREGEALEVGRVICSALKFATHLRPDLDAVLSVWICQRVRRHAGLQPAEVIFIPANTPGIEKDIFAIDVGSGKGIQPFGSGLALKRSSIGGSAALAVYRALPDAERLYIESVAHAVSDADERGENIHTILLKQPSKLDGASRWDDLYTRNQVLTTTMWTMFHSLAQKCKDSEILRIFSIVFDGMMEAGNKRQEASRAAKEARYLLDGNLAILPRDAPPPTSRAAYEKGAKIVLFSSNIGGDRWTLGLSRKNGDDAKHIDLNSVRDELQEYVPGIFVHPDGYMAGWTVKAPLRCTETEFKAMREALVQGTEEVVRKLLESKR